VAGLHAGAAARAPLREVFVDLARRHGRGPQWRFFIARTLGVAPSALDGLAAAAVPTTDAECGALALRFGIDGWLLRRVVAAGARPRRA
jgi:hypothetical protein